MNLAQDLLRKSSGYIHEMPESVMTKRKLSISGTSRRPPMGKYVDETGLVVTCLSLAIKYGTNEAKVRKAFSGNTPEKAHKILKTDLRVSNGQRGVYFLPDGTDTSSQKVADFYGVSRSVIQRAWTAHDKDPVKANAYLMERYFVD